MLFCAGLLRFGGRKQLKHGWITSAEFRDALAKAGSSATAQQVERWRREGLLPHPRQIGHGRGKGSHAEVQFVSVAQVQEIVRLYAIRRKRDWVGWQLWLRGFDVAERYWREPLENARKALLDTRKAAMRYERSSQTAHANPTAIKDRVLSAVRNTPLYAPKTKIPAEYVETLTGFFQEIVLGEFTGFSRESNLHPNQKERNAVLRVMGANTAGSRLIAGFSATIESELQDIAKAFAVIARRNSIAEPSREVRHEFLAAMEIGTSIYWISKPILGRRALDIFNRIATNPAIARQAAMLLGWTEYRNVSNSILPLSAIDEMRNSTITIASKFRTLTTKI